MNRICTEAGCDRPHRARGLCSMHWRRRHGKPERHRITCAWCGTSHETPRRDGRYCSRECYGAMLGYEAGTNACDLPQGHPALPEHIPNKTKWPSVRVFFTTCAVCRTLFATPHTVLTCGQQCAETKRRNDKREARHRRRALQRDAFIAPVFPGKIFERDGWRCHICRRKVRKSAVVPHPLAPTIDHVIPLAAGGTHEPANVATAHFVCNSTKGDRAGGFGDQLALIG